MPKGMDVISVISSMETMRLKYIVLAAKLIRTSSRKLILQLSKFYPYKKEFHVQLREIYIVYLHHSEFKTNGTNLIK